MDLTAHIEESIGGAQPAGGHRYFRENGPGILGSIALHVLGALLLVFFISNAMVNRHQPANTQTISVDVVHYGEQTTSPPELKRSPIPRQRSVHIPVPQTSSPRPPEGIAPKKAAPAVDELAAKLRGLARLRETNTVLAPVDNSPNSDTDSTSDDAGAGDQALYGVRDFIRAQVERRWSLDLSLVNGGSFKVRVHVQMNARGVVTLAEVVDQQRFKTDKHYHEIALSARNAVLLSSPFALPPGNYHDGMDMTLSLDPRDTLH